VSGNEIKTFLAYIYVAVYFFTRCLLYFCLYLIILCVTAAEDDVALTTAGDIVKSVRAESPVTSDSKVLWFIIGLLTGLSICFIVILIVYLM